MKLQYRYCMQDLARELFVEQRCGLGESFYFLASLALVDDRRVDEGDQMRNGWRWQTAGDCIAAVRTVPDYATARGCKLGGSLLGKNYLGMRSETSQF